MVTRIVVNLNMGLFLAVTGPDWFLSAMKGSSHLTHPGGFIQQELEGVVCRLRGLQLRVTERHQIVLHMLVDPAVQGLSRDEHARDRGTSKERQRLELVGTLRSPRPGTSVLYGGQTSINTMRLMCSWTLLELQHIQTHL